MNVIFTACPILTETTSQTKQLYGVLKHIKRDALCVPISILHVEVQEFSVLTLSHPNNIVYSCLLYSKLLGEEKRTHILCLTLDAPALPD